MLVRIVKSALHRRLFLRQTPAGEGIWDGVQFTLEPVESCDYLILLNRPPENLTVVCPPQHVWSIIHEPPVACRKAWHLNPPYASRMFTTDVERSGKEYIHSQPAIFWMVNRDYDFLVSFTAPEKTQQLSWITSRQTYLKGHRDRMGFLAKIQGQVDFDLWGRDFNPIDDKWDGLISYRYSLAIENYSNPFYWSEKLADCYLAWCMPIYYGCTRITDYFPAESMIQIDIHDPDAAVAKIKEAIASNAWQRNLDAIAYARSLVLNRYQFFPFMVSQIRHFESSYGAFSPKQLVSIPKYEEKRIPMSALSQKLKR
ncbi:hypothetical protein BJP34_10300 [Moorena producens PAL-8-15-08-1]|uniref:Fucosyltransferase C-terminal domain-containing protein n=1 Tax=Moorena producens PAL-8-15-08-1 TaxID=1458985 RepID=A0A1D8TQD3_9CYAN|nr:glycosyltransferase family 10 [Moorena producens]AOW99793.1 hypothetical protein BJP34_10300 [Moorena producens PAL-8-15-08-1]